ncbi:MAG: hypothetical protein HZC54_00670 [Verrucomicrobia bacterium]|nr:hypothetical protein [Verrucomicrobiota bacterium]
MKRLLSILACTAALSGAAFAQYAPPVMQSPAPGSAMTNNPATFTWSSGVGPTSWALWIGPTTGTYSYLAQFYESGGPAAVTLPVGGSNFVVRLWWNYTNVWHSNDYAYVLWSEKAGMAMPTPGGRLGVNPVAFSWSAGVGVSEYALDIGTNTGGATLLTGSQGTNLGASVNLPAGDSTLYVRLFSKIAGSWQSNDYTYTTFNSNVVGGWISMDYRPPGFLYQNLTWPNSNTIGSDLWRAIRQLRAEAKGFGGVSHNLDGSHPAGSILSHHIPNHTLTNGIHYDLNQAAYFPGRPSLTNISYSGFAWAALMTSAVVSATPRFVTAPGTGTHFTIVSGNGRPAIDGGNPGYWNNPSTLTLLSGNYVTPATVQVSFNVETNGEFETTNYVCELLTGGDYLTEPPLAFETDGNGCIIVIDAGNLQTLAGSVLFTNLVAGDWFRLNSQTRTWTGIVESVAGDKASLWLNSQPPWTNAPGLTASYATGVTTNTTVAASAWELLPQQWLNFSHPVENTNNTGGTILLGPNGLKLWWQYFRWDMAYGGSEFANLYPPWVDAWGITPPMSNVFALVVKPVSPAAMLIGSGGVQFWTNAASMLMLPSAALMTNAGGALSGGISVRQFWGQPARFMVNAADSLNSTGGVVVIAIGQ